MLYSKDTTAVCINPSYPHDQKHLELKFPHTYPEKLFWTSQHTILLFACAHSLQRFTTNTGIFLFLQVVSQYLYQTVTLAFFIGVHYCSFLQEVLLILHRREIPSLSPAFCLACTFLFASSFGQMIVPTSRVFMMTLKVLFSNRRTQQAVSRCWPFKNFSVRSA